MFTGSRFVRLASATVTTNNHSYLDGLWRRPVERRLEAQSCEIPLQSRTASQEPDVNVVDFGRWHPRHI